MVDLGRADIASLGIPSEADYAAAYARRTERESFASYDYCIAFNFFRLAAIFEGVVSRAVLAGKPDEEIDAVRRYGPIFARHGLTIAGER